MLGLSPIPFDLPGESCSLCQSLVVYSSHPNLPLSSGKYERQHQHHECSAIVPTLISLNGDKSGDGTQRLILPEFPAGKICVLFACWVCRTVWNSEDHSINF